MKPFWTYMVLCGDGTYYVGHTDNLERRIAEHNEGVVPGYTRKRKPVTLVWAGEFPTRIDALEREMQIKGWSRKKKESLIRGDWDRLCDSAKKRFNR
ncbi:MAG: GIY-YIG nuclease family protein [Candidatus Eisenbacteria bacterium]